MAGPQHKTLIAGWLLVQSDSLFCCGKWKKQFCVLTEAHDFQIFPSDKPGATPVFAQKHENLIDSYKSFAGDLAGSFIAVFTDAVVHFRAEYDSEMANWLSRLTPIKGKNHLLDQVNKEKSSTKSGFMSIKEFIDQNKEFWFANVSLAERTNHLKEAMSYMAELLDYTICKKNAEKMKAGFGKIVAAGKPTGMVKKEEIVIEVPKENKSEGVKK